VIYVNGDSYSKSNGKNYGDYLSELFNQPLMHKGIEGSSNNRIFRTTTRDLLKLKKQGVENCYVIIGLSFWFRTELWIEDHGIARWNQFEFDDGEFASFQAAGNLDWFTASPIPDPAPNFYKPFLKEWVKTAQADGVIINTIYKAALLKHLCENLGYKLVIFWAGDMTKDIRRIDPKLDALKDFYAEFNETNSFNLLDFSFVHHYYSLGYKPHDYKVHKEFGHPTTEVHKMFADKIYEKLL
jgi:hypothetical protein